MKLLFWRADQGEKIMGADIYDVDGYRGPKDLEYAAEEYAKYYWSERDGWEAGWPIDFHIASEDGNLIGIVSVNMEVMPRFFGRIYE